MRLFAFITLTLLPIFQLQAQPCDTTALVVHKVSAKTTDPNIGIEAARHHSFYNPLCTSKNTLLFYMVGTIGSPSNDLLFTKMAANHGYHVISLKYVNNKSATTACSNDNDTNCYENFHKEAIFGTDLISAISIDTTNSILNRAVKLLQYLDANFPTENWGQFLTGNTIDWTKVITGGHSQGSGHAAYLGHLYPVQRVLMFSGPNEYMNNHSRIAPWFGVNNLTADSNYYAFGNTNDEVSFPNQLTVWNKLGLNNYGDTVNVIPNSCPYANSKMLFTSNVYTGAITPNHNSTMVDNYTPKDGNGFPLFEEVWKYMLNLCGITTSIQLPEKENDTFHVYPNPATNEVNISVNRKLYKVTINLSDLFGKVVLNESYSTLTSTKISLKNKLNPGIYFLTLSSGELVQTEKIIIE